MFELLIDTRETLLKNHFINNYNKDSVKDIIRIEVKQLELGDLIINYKFSIDDVQKNIPIMIIERKTICDLCSSIRDGRHKEQKMRLLNSYNNSIVYYLIEGSIENEVYKSKKYTNDEKMIYGSIINCLVRDNIKIIKTDKIEETIKYIEYIISKLQKQPDIFKKNINLISNQSCTNNDNTNVNASNTNNTNNNQINNDYSATIKTKKKDNMTPEICYLFQLCQIPGVSNNSAKIIAEKYPKMCSLINEYGKMETEKEKELMLSELKMTGTTGKVRKLGPVLSKRIYSYLL